MEYSSKRINLIDFKPMVYYKNTMSISNLLVPNNFDITDGGGQTGGISNVAGFLKSGAGANEINVESAANPVAGQVLTATSGTVAVWQTPSYSGIPNGPALNVDILTTLATSPRETLIEIPAGAVDGSWFVEADVVGYGSGTPRVYAYKAYAAFRITGGVLSLSPSQSLKQISDTAVTNGPLFVAVAGPNRIQLKAGGDQVRWKVALTSMFVEP